MKVVFRVDSSTLIGTGHLMRCMTLAKELEKKNAEILFVTRLHAGNVAQLIEKNGFRAALLEEFIENATHKNLQDGYASWLGAPSEQDAEETISAISELKPDWIIVDHYAIDRDWETLLRPHVRRIMVIDDLANREHDCDYLLDQNYYHDMGSRYTSLVPETCDLHLGPQYALLREEFLRHKANDKDTGKREKSLFLFFGGSDPHNLTGKVLEAIVEMDRIDLSVNIVIGSNNPNRERINEKCKREAALNLLIQAENMAELMSQAVVAIGAGGSTTWERCCLGLPSVIITNAQNQEQTTRDLADDGYLVYLGRHEEDFSQSLEQAINLLLDNSPLRKALSKKSQQLVDGRGVERVTKKLLTKEIQLRSAVESDSNNIFNWRNAESTRQYFIDPHAIDREEHDQWFEKKLNDPSCIILLGETTDGPVGVIRYDFEDEVAKVSVYLVPEYTGQGYGASLIKEGSRWLREKYQTIKEIQADILPANKASIGAFLQAGFEHFTSTYRYRM